MYPYSLVCIHLIYYSWAPEVTERSDRNSSQMWVAVRDLIEMASESLVNRLKM